MASGPPRRLLHVFSTFAVGGAQARTAALIRALGPGLEHLLVAADGRTEAIDAFGLAGAVRPIDAPFAKGRGIAPSNLARVRRLLRAERPALLLTYNFGALEAALANRLPPSLCPHLHLEDGFGPEEGAGVQLRRRVWLRRLALGRRARIVVPSRTLERLAVERWGFGPDRVVRIPNGIDLDRFAAAGPAGPAAAPPLARRPGELRVGTVGALRPEKNLARLLRAFAALPPSGPTVRLVLVGEGGERGRLSALADELGLADRVVLAGQVDRPEEVLASLDLFALSSDTEQMPIGLIEAMAAGLPVVATDVGDVADMLPPAQRPFVVAREAEGRLAAAMAELLADPALRGRLGAANRAHARANFGEAAMTERHRRVLEDSMADGRRAAGGGPARPRLRPGTPAG